MELWRPIAAAAAAVTLMRLSASKENDEPVRWQQPTAASASDDTPLSQDHVASWRQRGYVAVDGLLPPELIAAARREMDLTPPGRLGNGLMLPSLPSLNAISTHLRLRTAARQLLGTKSLTLLQSEAWSKAAATFGGKYDNQDQRMHVTRADAQTTASGQHPTAQLAPCCRRWTIPTITSRIRRRGTRPRRSWRSCTSTASSAAAAPRESCRAPAPTTPRTHGLTRACRASAAPSGSTTARRPRRTTPSRSRRRRPSAPRCARAALYPLPTGGRRRLRSAMTPFAVHPGQVRARGGGGLPAGHGAPVSVRRVAPRRAARAARAAAPRAQPRARALRRDAHHAVELPTPAACRWLAARAGGRRGGR